MLVVRTVSPCPIAPPPPPEGAGRDNLPARPCNPRCNLIYIDPLIHPISWSSRMDIYRYSKPLQLPFEVNGIFFHPVRLQIQCFLFIIGHIYEWPADIIGLLPQSIRVQILLFLPAVDVVKLESTPVAYGISMDEVWEILCKERLPPHTCWIIGDTDVLVDKVSVTSKDLKEKGIQSASWKDAYFTSVFALIQFYSCQSLTFDDKEYCSCMYPHFQYDLFYGIYNCRMSSTNFYCSLSNDKSASFHDIYCCAEKCSRLTTRNYYQRFLRHTDSSFDFSIDDLVNIYINDCNLFIKYLNISEELYKYMLPFINNGEFLKKFCTFLGSVESVAISPFISQSQDKMQFMTKLLDMIFTTSTLTSFDVQSHFTEVLPYLNKSHSYHLKQLRLSIKIDEDYDLDLSGTALCFIESSNSVMTLNIEESLSSAIEKLLQLHQELECFEFRFDSFYKEDYTSDSVLLNSSFFHALSNLMYRPIFKQVSLDTKFLGHDISSDIIINLFCQFFLSPYPIILMASVTCLQFDGPLESLTLNPEMQSKSLKLDNCLLSSSFSSLFPRNIILKSLSINNNYADENTFCLFADLDSVKVDSISLTNVFVSLHNVDDLCSLFSIVDTKDWSLSIHIANDQNVFDKFMGSFSKIAKYLQKFELRNCEQEAKRTTSILCVIFESLSTTGFSYFQLTLSHLLVNDDLIKVINESWKISGAVKLKSIRIKVVDIKECKTDFENAFSDIADETILLKYEV